MIDIVKEMNKSAIINPNDISLLVNEDGIERYLVPFEIELKEKAISLLALTESLRTDENVSGLELNGNTLTYILFDDINVTVIESISPEGVSTLEINEDGVINILSFDTVNDQILLNGGLVETSTCGEYIFEKTSINARLSGMQILLIIIIFIHTHGYNMNKCDLN